MHYWCSNLKPSSIQSFDQLSQSFVAHFASSRKLRKGLDFLIHIKQREGEPLRSYMSRFNKMALEVYDLDHAVAMTAMKSGLQPGPFLFSLGKRSPTSFTELLTRAEKYARAEEACKPVPSTAAPQLVRPSGPPKFSAEPEDRSRKRRGRPPVRNAPLFHRPRRDPGPPAQVGVPPLWKYDEYTPLNAPRTEVLMQVRGEMPPT